MSVYNITMAPEVDVRNILIAKRVGVRNFQYQGYLYKKGGGGKIKKGGGLTPLPTMSYRDYLQNTQHVVLRNHPTLSIATERLV